ncbi:MAG: hypothetical protein U0354_05540 [Candidatus Sericytochromatia bacterium]
MIINILKVSITSVILFIFSCEYEPKFYADELKNNDIVSRYKILKDSIDMIKKYPDNQKYYIDLAGKFAGVFPSISENKDFIPLFKDSFKILKEYNEKKYNIDILNSLVSINRNFHILIVLIKI